MKNTVTVAARQQRAIDTRNAIIRVFFDLLKEKSMQEITVQMICKEANISVGAFYHHYTSKEDVLGESFHKFDELINDVLMHKQYSSAEEAILDLLFHEIIGARDNGINVTREILKLTLDPNAHNYFSDQNRTFHIYLKELINQAKEQGILRNDTDSQEMAILLLRHARGIGYDWVAHNGSYDLARALRYDLNLIFKGFKA